MVTRDPFETLEVEIEPIVRVFRREGIDVYPVGGCVRDCLLGRPLGEIDLATPAPPERVKKLFRRVIETGIKHGTVTILWNKDKKFEVTTFRIEGSYTDHRHPDKVTFHTDLTLDLQRRDFTINAMAWDPVRKVVVDPFGGREDLQKRVLRCVGVPTERFLEDPLRIFRLYRFQSQLDFQIAEETAAAAKALAPKCARVAWERKRLEWEKLLLGPAWVRARAGALATDLFPRPPNALERQPRHPEALECTPSWGPGRWAYHLWALGCRDVAHVDQELRRFRTSNRDRATILTTWQVFDLLGRGHRDAESYLDLCHDRGFREWFSWIPVFLDEAPARELLEALVRRLADPRPLYLHELPIDGNALIKAGFPPGKPLGILLQHLLAYARLQDGVVGPEDLLRYARRWHMRGEVNPPP